MENKMKLKVASNYVGTIVIPYLGMICKANSEFMVEEKTYNSAEIQKLLADKVLEVFDPNSHQLIQYKNLSKYKLSFSWGQVVGPLQSFFVTDDKINDKDILVFVKEGLITKVIQKNEVKNNQKIIKKKPIIKNKVVAKDNKSSKEPVQTTEYLNNQKVPNNVVIHKPKETSVLPLSSKSEENTETIKFVDHEQKVEKINKLQKVLNDKMGKV
jgi:hypothetical protein